MDLDIEGNAAVVTASSSGLGKASATALAREGADVVINGRGEDRLESAAREIREVATGCRNGASLGNASARMETPTFEPGGSTRQDPVLVGHPRATGTRRLRPGAGDRRGCVIFMDISVFGVVWSSNPLKRF